MGSTAEGFREGARVRFSAAGREKVRGMPEAWGLHTALTREEVGEVVELEPAGEGGPARVSVEFPSGGAYYWDAGCFELCEEPVEDERC